jgi:hypothetical protein
VSGQPQIQLGGIPLLATFGGLSVAGQAPFSYWWSKDGILLEDGPLFSSTHNTNLVALVFGPADAGGYQLIASNSFGMATSAVVQVTVHAVDAAGSTPVTPFSSWATAATNIQDAIDAAAAGDFVVVTNGLYATGGKAIAGTLTNRVALTKPLTVVSVNGPVATIIQGAWDPVTGNGPRAVRCAWLTDGAALSGFTLQNGATQPYDGNVGSPLASGAGVWCTSTNGVVSGCILTNNNAIYGGGISSGTLNNSLVVRNLAIIIRRPHSLPRELELIMGLPETASCCTITTIIPLLSRKTIITRLGHRNIRTPAQNRPWPNGAPGISVPTRNASIYFT